MDTSANGPPSPRNPPSWSMPTVPLDMISGLHSRVLALEVEHAGIPPFRSIPSGHLTEEAVLAVLFLRPIICRKTSSKFECVGNVRSYQLAKDNLDGKVKVPYLLLEKRKLVEIDRLFWTERFLIPITAELNNSGNKWLYTLWQSRYMVWNQIWRHPPLNKIRSRRAFARLLGMDERNLK